MKKQTVIRAVIAALFAASLWLGMSACDKPDGNRIEAETGGPENSLPLDNENPDQNNEPDTPDHEEKNLIYSAEAQTAIEQLQARLTSNTRLAVVYLGERARNEAEAEPLTEWLWNNVPGMMEKMPFLAEIPEEHILGGSYGDLYCVLPRKDDTTLVVRQIEWLTYGNGGVVLYHPYELEDGTTGFEFDCHGTWTLQDGDLQIEAYDPAGNPVGGTFRVRVSPSGDLYIYEAEDGTKLPFFEPEAHYRVLSPYEE